MSLMTAYCNKHAPKEDNQLNTRFDCLAAAVCFSVRHARLSVLHDESTVEPCTLDLMNGGEDFHGISGPTL
jgi:hypothetical protein